VEKHQPSIPRISVAVERVRLNEHVSHSFDNFPPNTVLLMTIVTMPPAMMLMSKLNVMLMRFVMFVMLMMLMMLVLTLLL